MSDEAISDYELEQERKHNVTPVKHDEYDEDIGEMLDRIETLEVAVDEIKSCLRILEKELEGAQH